MYVELVKKRAMHMNAFSMRQHWLKTIVGNFDLIYRCRVGESKNILILQIIRTKYFQIVHAHFLNNFS